MRLSGTMLISLLTLVVNQVTSEENRAVADQIAEESRPRGYRGLVAATDLPPDTDLEKFVKKYGENTKKRNTHYNVPQFKKMLDDNFKHKQKHTTSPVTQSDPQNLNPLHYERQTDRFRLAEANIQVLPKNSNPQYDGWMPIVPKIQPDHYNSKPRQETYRSGQIQIIYGKNPPFKRPQRQLSYMSTGYRPVMHSRNSIYNKRHLVLKKIAMKKGNSSGFSGMPSKLNFISTSSSSPKELETSETHHVEYKTKIKHHHHHHHHKYVQTVVKKIPFKVPVKVYVPKPYPVEKKVPYPVEKIVHKIIEKKVPYPVEKKVPYPVEVKVPQPYPVKVIEKEYVPKPYPVIKHVPIVKHVEVKVPIHHPVPYPVEKKVPYPVHIKVPYPVEKKVPYPVEVEKKVPFPVKVYIPKPYPVEKKVPYPVEVKVKEPYPVYKQVPVPVKVYVDKPYPVPVPKPYPVEVEKKIPYPVEVEKKIPIPVKVYVPQPYPVEKPYPVYIDKGHHEHSAIPSGLIF